MPLPLDCPRLMSLIIPFAARHLVGLGVGSERAETHVNCSVLRSYLSHPDDACLPISPIIQHVNDLHDSHKAIQFLADMIFPSFPENRAVHTPSVTGHLNKRQGWELGRISLPVT